jgi:hypothetical protein
LERLLKFKILGVLLLGLYFCLVQEVNTDDEAWFLQVVNRVASGEVLYRDVFFGSTPLSVFLAAFFAKLVGSELILLRGLLAVYFTLSVFLSCEILKWLGLKKPYSPLLLATFFILSHFQSTWGFSAYNALAKLFFLATFYFAPRSLKLAALFAGLCFCTKHNVGALALLAVLAAAFIRKQSPTTAFKIFAFISGLCLFLITLQGGLFEFFDYAFQNKRQYLSAEHCSYFLLPSTWDLYSIFVFAAPLLLGVFLTLAYPKCKGEKFSILLVFLLASALTLYPRPDNPQKGIFLGMTLITLRYLSSFIALPQAGLFALRAWVPFALVMAVANPWIGKEKRVSDIRHFKFLCVDRPLYEHWKNLRKSFPRDNQGFFLSTHAGFYYLLFKMQNPTPYDYPINPAMGSWGEQKIVSELRKGVIKSVFADHGSWSNWKELISDRRPYLLESYLEELESQEICLEKLANPIFQSFR